MPLGAPSPGRRCEAIGTPSPAKTPRPPKVVRFLGEGFWWAPFLKLSPF